MKTLLHPTTAILVFLFLLAAPGRAAALPEQVYIPGVTGHPQGYSLSCESRAAADLAAFWGLSISESEFLVALPRSDNPDAGFVGDPNAAWGSIPPNAYGVHAAPVSALLNQYGMETHAQKGLSWEDLKQEIASGRPAIVWVIGQMWSGSPLAYIAADGTQTVVARFEHVMILVGYSPQAVTVVDAYSGIEQTYPLQTFLTSWSVLGNMAVTGQGETPAPGARKLQPGGSYQVQRGDYLIELARRFNLDWQDLANINGLQPPYTLYAGQTLTLPQSGSSQPTPAAPTPEPVPSPTPAAAVAREDLKFRAFLPGLRAGDLSPAEGPAANNIAATYTVEAGDYLKAIADRFGLGWLDLAQSNGIEYPYIVYPGQVLKLP